MKRKKVLTIVGARPQFVKAAPVSRALRKKADEILVHTGQHYDASMSQVFFDELAIPAPDYNLEIGSAPHGEQTGLLLERIEKVINKEKPDWVLVYGDTNSTLAGALAAAKLHIPVAHVEAGLRSYDRAMPEEVNRVLTDHVSSLLLCPTKTSVANLKKEGIVKGVHWTGDVMYDAFLAALKQIAKRNGHLKLPAEKYALATIHRASNTASKHVLQRIFNSFGTVPLPVIMLVHPRTEKAMQAWGVKVPGNVEIRPPAGHLEMLALQKNAELILTDSGGVQKEAYFCEVPCLTLRDTTEWTETTDSGWNKLTHMADDLSADAKRMMKKGGKAPKLFGDGRAAEKIVAKIVGR